MSGRVGPYRPVVLVILDGWGQAPGRLAGEDASGPRPGPEAAPAAARTDAIAAAATPHLDRLMAGYPGTLLGASGAAVGLRPGQMGDSNVGHLNLGAGRIVYQELVRVDRAAADGSLLSNPTFAALCRRVVARSGILHLMGLLSDGGVHSHLDHVAVLLEAARRHRVRSLAVHAFLDGRDVPPRSAAGYLEWLENRLRDQAPGAGGDWRLATIGGRYFAMDRDGRWERTGAAFMALAGSGPGGGGEGGGGEAVAGHPDPVGWRAALEQAYQAGQPDEFVPPRRLAGAVPFRPGRDAGFFWNFRADRGRQLTRAFIEPELAGFSRPAGWPVPEGDFATLTRYDAGFTCPVALEGQDLGDTLGEVVARAGRRQLRLAETEKYAHVTFFFSGGREEPFWGEDRVLVPSPQVSTYDLRPEMSAPAVTAAAVEALRGGRYDLVVMNYANCDMVGHTGDFEAARQAVEAVDQGLGQVVEAVLAAGGAAFITSDHGNAEQMTDGNTGWPHTAHTANPVPALLVAAGLPAGLRLRPGILADVAPTILELMGLPQPGAMEASSLLAGPGRTGDGEAAPDEL